MLAALDHLLDAGEDCGDPCRKSIAPDDDQATQVGNIGGQTYPTAPGGAGSLARR